MTDETKRTAFSYIRLSSKKQVIDGDGIRRQTELAREYCIASNLTLSTKSFRDLGISAFKEKNRPSLADLLECIQNGTIQEGDTIILEKLDRLSRKGIDDTIHQLRSILQHGVELVSLMDNLRLSRNSLNDLISIIRIAVASDLARQESETKSKRVRENKAAMKKLAANGIATRKRLPMWLTYSDPDHKYVLNDNADVVLRMFELRENGVALGEIARRLNAEDVPTPNNRKWVASTVSMILGSVSLYGAYQTLDRQQDGSYTKGKVIRDYYPVLVPYERWKPVQSSAVRIAGGHSKINHLSGLCFCVCGGAISFKKNNAQRKTKATYHYCRKHAFGTCDNRHCVRDLEKLVIKYSNRLDVENVPVSDTNSHLQQQIDEIEVRIAELGSSLSTVGGAVISVIVNAIADLDNRKKELTKELSRVVDIPRDAGSTLYQYADDPVRFNVELKKIVKMITIKPMGKKHFVSMHRHDGHVISFHTADVLQPSDTKKLSNELKDLVDGVEEWE